MNATRVQKLLAATLALALALASTLARAADALPSWNDGAAKKSIVEFVAKVTKQGAPDFVPPAERIAVFDNDGTLWAEQPMYFQGLFLLDRVKALAPKHPEWKTKEPFASLLTGDMTGVAAAGEKGLMEMLVATHTGMTTWAYDRKSHVGQLDKAWDQAVAKGRTVVDMKKDWKRVFPFEK